MFKRTVSLCLALVLMAGGFYLPQPARAVIGSCEADVNPHTITRNTDQRYTFTLDSVVGVERVTITSPSGNFTLTAASGTAWNANIDGNDAVFIRGGAAANVVYVDATSGSSDAPAADWTVTVSDDPGGASPTTCTGNLDTAISGAGPDTTPPTIDDVSLSNLSTSSVTISWTTNEAATSQVHYGTTEDYGSSSAFNGTLTTTHSVQISNLSASTSYHYQVVSQDGDDNEATSDDNTFLTPVSGSSGSSSGLDSTPLTTKVPIKNVATEKVPPTITLNTDFTKPFKLAPNITGVAEDNEAVATVEYSQDDGKNWLPVTTAADLGSKKVIFSFTPAILQDGNYKVLARAFDTSGNTAVTATQTLVLDRLPPIVGGNVLSRGSQTILPNENGQVLAQIGVDQKITLSAVGGPTSVTLSATQPGNDKVLQTFSLSQSADTGLWSGVVSFSKVGQYQLMAQAVDGAGNTTSRVLNTVDVQADGKVTDKAGSSVEAKVTVYFRDPETNAWESWDAQAYGQENPLLITAKQGLSFYLPEGTYYLKLSAPGYRSIITSSFTLTSATSINPSYELTKAFGFSIGKLHIRLPWWDFSSKTTSIAANTKEVSTALSEQPLGQFSLALTNGKTFKTADLYGQPTIMTFISTWSEQSREQLAILNELPESTVGVIPVGSGESYARLLAYTKLAGYHVPILVDAENQLAAELKLSTIPVTYFIDRHGVVKTVKVGVLSRKELEQNVPL